jgi:hypothetical protein
LLEAESGEKLAAFFDGWVLGNESPLLEVGFESIAPDRIRTHVTGHGARPLLLELWIELEDGAVVRRRVELPAEPGSLELEVPGAVRTVRPNPRHDALLGGRSSQPADVDFDQEVDGIDLAQCAFAAGRQAAVEGVTNEGFRGLDLDFEPRCDLDGNATIDDADLAQIRARFGAMREVVP